MDIAFELKKYSIIAGGYLLSSLSKNELKQINSFILFGSIAQNRGTAESDVDFFIDAEGHPSYQRTLRTKLNKAAADFYLTSTALDFKLKGLSNELSITVGKLDDWPELRQSIAAAGIILYAQYASQTKPPHTFAILSWEKPGKAKGAFLNKIYGYRAKGKRYPGLLEKHNGTKLGRATIMIPAGKRDAFIEALEKYKINYSRWDVWV